MTPFYADDAVTLYEGDALAVLAELPTASVDAVVTDPPYGLEFMGRDWDSFRYSNTGPQQTDFKDLGPLPSYSPNRRNQKCPDCNRWAYDHPGRKCECGGWKQPAQRGYATAYQVWCQAWAAECLRVLKPGGHLLAFGGTRTAHRLTCAIEDAGFEIRDSIAWLYGSGFPKSLDVSKAIDKRAEENAETQRRIALVAEVIRAHREAKGMERGEVSLAVVGSPSGACWNWEHQQLPSIEMWPAIKRVLDIPDKFDGLIEGDRARFIAAEREVIGRRMTGISTGRGAVPYISDSDNRDLTAPATDDARRWSGWGTALKPAHETIVVARKPLAGTVAANVLAHGTGALNIDATRVGETVETWPATRSWNGWGAALKGEHKGDTQSTGDAPAGRWPSNVVLDEAAAAELDRQSGILTSGANPTRRGSDKFRDAYGEFAGQSECTPARGVDTGGASRFFPVFRYEPKAPTAERPRDGAAAHPTVKPLDLMRWLVRLVTPPGGVVLDPFAGSGTTAEACVIEGFRCITVEREPSYLPLIVARLSKPIQPTLGFEEVA